MPRGFLDLDVQFPRLEGMEDDRARFISIEDHERMMLENLRYILRNIGPDNFNQAEVIAWLLSLGLGKGRGAEQYALSMTDVIEVVRAAANERTAILGSTGADIGGTIAGVSTSIHKHELKSVSYTTAAADGSIGGKTQGVTVVAVVE